jgi:ketosteroid isomerase-like protein
MSSATMNVSTESAQVTRDEAEIRALIDALNKAHYDKDAAGIAAPFAPDAAVFDLSPPLIHHGVSAKEKQAWLDTWEGPIELESQDLKVTVSGDYAFCHGFVRMSGTPKAAGRRISFWMRATRCFHREGGSWRIVHDHTSVPFYMDGSLRPAFDLLP